MKYCDRKLDVMSYIIKGKSACRSTNLCVMKLISPVSDFCLLFVRLCPQNWICINQRSKNTNMKLKDLRTSFRM